MSASDLAPAARAPQRRARGRVAGARRVAASPPQAPAPVPVGLDGAEVLEVARSRFLRLQAAWDAGDVQALGQPDDARHAAASCCRC